MKTSSRTLVVIATYNEIENVPRLIDGIFAAAPEVDILVVDDNSPDGTGRWCDQRAPSEPRLFCLHREKKEGLGAATIAGLRYALDGEYTLAITMDADFSHDPRHLPQMIKGIGENCDQRTDVVIGSRYIAGGGVEGWPWTRRLMSRSLNLYSRFWLGLPVRDCTGAYRCYRTDTLVKLDLNTIQSRGYAYLEEMLWRLHRLGATFREIPIIFRDREFGQTKINWREAAATLWVLFRLGVGRWKGRKGDSK